MKRISVVEAMRALASISVALFHFCNQLYSTGAQLVASYGWLGVDVFFVISGFVIPLSLYGRRYGVRDFPSFLLRRLVRLEPAYLVSIAAVVVLQYASSVAPGFRGQMPDYSFPQLASHLLYLVPLTNYDWLLPVYWSLAYEFVFYVTVGLTFSYLIGRSVAVTVALALGALGLKFVVYNMVDVHKPLLINADATPCPLCPQNRTCAVQLAGFLHRRWNPVRYRRVGHSRSVCLGL